MDKIGRRKILIQSSIQTFVAELALGIVFAFSVDTDTVVLGSTPSIASIALVTDLLSPEAFLELASTMPHKLEKEISLPCTS